MTDNRPTNCRNRLRDEGKAYPKSGCDSCHDGGLRGCPHEQKASEPAEGSVDAELEVLQSQVSVLRLQDGDCLVIKSPELLSIDHATFLVDRGKKLLRDLGVSGEVIIADGGIELQVMRKAQEVDLHKLRDDVDKMLEFLNSDLPTSLSEIASSIIVQTADVKKITEAFGHHGGRLDDPRRRG